MNMDPLPITLTISENQETAEKLQNDEGKFLFLPALSFPSLSMKPQENDEETENFLKSNIHQDCLKSFELWHLYTNPHPNNTQWAGHLTCLLAQGCQEIFYPRLKSEMIPKDFSFFALHYGLEVDGNSPDFVLTLGQKEGMLRIPLLLFEEKLPLESLDEATPQLSKYAKKIFSQEVSFGEKIFGFENAYILTLFQKTRQAKLIHYRRPTEDKILKDCVKYSCEFGLFQNGTCELKEKYVHDLFRVLFNCVYLQLKSLDLIN